MTSNTIFAIYTPKNLSSVNHGDSSLIFNVTTKGD